MRVFCATTNAGKLRELERAGAGVCEIVQLPGMREIPAPVETGLTFRDNAIQKALYYGQFTHGWLIAEDSGLAVDALAGAPGVLSARYAGEAASDAANNQRLIEMMRGVPDRTCRFVCVIALVRAGKLVRTFEGEVEGRLLESPRGSEGFGYDPLFFYPPFQCTFAEVPRETKQSVSHRGRALSQLLEYLGAGAP